jgi:hypothetical protein
MSISGCVRLHFQRWNSTLPSLRTLPILAMLASLLLGNVAGIVHLGCGESNGYREGSAIQTQAHACGCHRLCASPNDSSEESPQPSPAVPHDSEHDSDHCGICQSFYVARFAVAAPVQATVWKPLLTERLFVDLHSQSVVPVFLHGLSVRGPPQA